MPKGGTVKAVKTAKLEKVSKVSKNTKGSSSKKVADLQKGKKKPATKTVTGFSRGLGLFFISVIGLLAGLLLFNLIVHFGVSDVLEEASLSASLSSATGTVVKSSTFTPDKATGVYFTFDHNTTSTVSYFNKGGDTFGVYVMDTVPHFSPEGPSVMPVASFEFSQESVDDTATGLLKKGGTSKKMTVDGTSATEIQNPNETFKYLVFKGKNVVYVGKFSTEKSQASEARLIENSIALQK